jgi:hypothetical protein
LVVGPSPVITPSRTIVSAWAEVSRQDGSRDGDSTDLCAAADIVHFQISSDRPAFSCRRKGVVNDSVRGSRLFEIVANWSLSGPFWFWEATGERDGSHKRLSRGNHARIAPVEMFRRRRRCNKKVLGNQAFKEGIHILLEAVQLAFTWDREDLIMVMTVKDEFSSKFNSMR